MNSLSYIIDSDNGTFVTKPKEGEFLILIDTIIFNERNKFFIINFELLQYRAWDEPKWLGSVTVSHAFSLKRGEDTIIDFIEEHRDILKEYISADDKFYLVCCAKVMEKEGSDGKR